MRLTVDQGRCIGSGMCALTAPEIFDQDTDRGLVLLLDPAPPPGHHASAREAVHACPAEAITIYRDLSQVP